MQRPEPLQRSCSRTSILYGEPVGADLAALFAGVDLTVEEGRSAVCMSGPDTPECGPMFGAVGLEYAGTGGQNQSFFRAMSSP